MFLKIHKTFKWSLKRRPKLVYKMAYRLMQVKHIADCSPRAFCNTFTFIKPPFVFKTFVLSIFEWPLKTGFTVIE